MFEALALEAAQEIQTPLSPAGQREADALNDSLRSLRSDQNDLEAELRAIDADSGLSDEGRQASRQNALSRWNDSATALIAQTEASAARAIRIREARINPAPLHIDPTVAEARSANARTDARMLLDPVEPNKLRERMSQLAESGDPSVRWLLSATSWGHTYLQSRGVTDESRGRLDSASWENNRLKFVLPYLNAEGQTALNDLTGLRSLAATVPASLGSMQAATLARHGFRK